MLRDMSSPAAPHRTRPEVVSRLRLAVLRVARRMRQQANAGVTASQLSVLATVERHGPVGLKELAAIERVQPPSITRIVAALEDAGLVVRAVSPQDRRAAQVSLTADGTHDVTQGPAAARRVARPTPRHDGPSGRRGHHTRALPALERLIEDRP